MGLNYDLFRKLRLWPYLVLLAVFIGACGILKRKKEIRINKLKKTSNKTLSFIPTKNLEDFYDKKVFEMKSLKKEIKGLGESL